MYDLTLLTAYEVQLKLAQSMKSKRKQLKYSRKKMALLSGVPASTIKRFENSAQISLRQFVLLWQCVDDLQKLVQISKPTHPLPQSIEDVVNND